jgi:hypothetical protein
MLNLAGTFTLSAPGELVLTLHEPCTAMRYDNGTADDGPLLDTSLRGSYPERCNRSELDRIFVTAAIPWTGAVRGTWVDSQHLVFHINWAQSNLDPLDDDATRMAAMPWKIQNVYWGPSAEESAQILELARKADQEVVTGGPPPRLEVIAIDVEGGALRSGDESTLIVQVTNHGAGTAYQVAASTRSSLTSLHMKQLAFGMIKPGAHRARKLRIRVPPSETLSDAMLVLVITEGNGFAPANASKRIKIIPPTNTPKLDVRCAFAGSPAASPAFEAGQGVLLSCIVNNTGNATAMVELEIATPRAPTLRSRPEIVAVGGRVAFEIPLTLSRDLPLDSTFEVAVTASDSVYSSVARTTITGVIRKAKLCEIGQLTLAQYRAKVAELRAAAAAGDLTQAQLDRYDAELVACLQ